MVAKLPDGVYEASASIDDDGVIKGEQVPIRVKVTIKGGDMTIDLVRLLGRAQGRASTRAPMPARASPTRR